MKVVAFIVNFIFPGVGSLLLKKIGTGIIQIILYLIGLAFMLTGIGIIIGAPVCFVVWIWGLVTAASAPAEPVQVVVTHKNEPSSS